MQVVALLCSHLPTLPPQDAPDLALVAGNVSQARGFNGGSGLRRGDGERRSGLGDFQPCRFRRRSRGPARRGRIKRRPGGGEREPVFAGSGRHRRLVKRSGGFRELQSCLCGRPGCDPRRCRRRVKRRIGFGGVGSRVLAQSIAGRLCNLDPRERRRARRCVRLRDLRRRVGANSGSACCKRARNARPRAGRRPAGGRRWRPARHRPLDRRLRAGRDFMSAPKRRVGANE